MQPCGASRLQDEDGAAVVGLGVNTEHQCSEDTVLSDVATL